MWDDASALRMSANLLFGLAAALALYGAVHYSIHLPILPLRDIQVTGDVAHVTHEQVEAVVTRELRGNFFTVDLAHARAAFEKLPWVRKVNVRRQWPDRLEFSVEEHSPLARWGSTALVSAQGEVFEAAINATLPVLQGPEGTAPEVVSRFQAFELALEPVGKHIVHMTLSARRAWVLKLDDGMVLELGRDNLDSRLGGFVAAYERTVARMPQPSTYIDLRYTNGFAVRSPGLKWTGKNI
ncbi:MAG: FtsQ-type POTRA domain-containing protein [Prolixibacteraceae bacterium]|nr:FtsQ-type POTRA domain-containing protein [Burkholderiales bacterium]